jgi:molybdenum cofactor cytidylyltransferase
MNDRGDRAVILAAGSSSRIGKQKLLMEFRGKPLIEHAIAAARRWDPVVLAGPEVCVHLAARSDVVVVRNGRPEMGMSHSLALADRFLREDVALLVLLGDKPLVSEALIETICRAAGDADVVYPLLGEEPGHPVRLSPRARKRVASLPHGDTLRHLRADPNLTVKAVETLDVGAVFDVDTIGAFET